MADVFVPGSEIRVLIPQREEAVFFSKILGNKKNEYVIIDLPSGEEEQAPPQLDSEEICRVEFIDNTGRSMTFEMVCIDSITEPVSVAFLSFPTFFESSRPRMSPRHKVNLETLYRTRSDDGEWGEVKNSLMVNISRGGCLIQTDEPFLPEISLFIDFQFPDQAVIHDEMTICFDELPPVNGLEGVVRYSQRKGEEYFLGLEFIDPSQPEYQSVSQFMQYLEALQIRL